MKVLPCLGEGTKNLGPAITKKRGGGGHKSFTLSWGGGRKKSWTRDFPILYHIHRTVAHITIQTLIIKVYYETVHSTD